MTIQEILNKVDNVALETSYWFIRTNYGEHFDQFTVGNYIAIGWDYFTLDEIKNDEKVIRDKIVKFEKLDLDNSADKATVTSTFNKISIFLNLKKNDIIVVPSKNSDRLAFGRIADNEAYEDEEARSEGFHFKRRKVEWLEIKNIKSLNPIFYQVKSNRHSVSNIDRFAPFIDKVIGNLYKKGDNTHYVLNIEKSESINFDELRSLMDNIDTLIRNINSELSFNENLDEFYIKMNLQSKGTVELIKAGKSLTILAFLLNLVSCGEINNNENEKIQQLLDNNREVLLQTQKDIESLEVNTQELIKPFKNGN